MILYLVRHGEPDYENDCLTEIGKKQAELVAKRLLNHKIDKIYTSSKGRAIETAQPFCELTGKESIKLDWAREISCKVTFEDGKEDTLAAVSNVLMRGEQNDKLTFDNSFECFGFEGLKEKYNRVAEGGREWLASLGYKEENGLYKITNPNEERIALFCHGNMARAFISNILHIPIHTMWAGFVCMHTGVTVIRFTNHPEGYCAPRVLTFADVSHLYVDGKIESSVIEW